MNKVDTLTGQGTCILRCSNLCCVVFCKTRSKDRTPPTCTNDKKLKFYKTYSAESCFNECIARLIFKSCKCYTLGQVVDELVDDQRLQVPVNAIPKDQICSPKMATNCLLPLLMEKTSSFLWELYDLQEECNCPIACRRSIFRKNEIFNFQFFY